MSQPAPPPLDRDASADHDGRIRLRTAAARARRVYPGPIGQLISREISNWEEYGYRLGGRGLIGAIVDQVMRTPVPEAA